MFLSYYTGNVGLSLLSPFLGTGTIARLVAKVILIAIIFVVISRAKEKTFTIMALGSLFLVLIIPALAILSMSQIPKNAEAISSAWRMLLSSHPITFSLLREATDRAIYAVGLGFGFYIMLGSFLNERFNPKVIIGTGVFIQFILGILSTIAIIYIAAPTDPSAFNEYVAGGEEAAIALLGKLPDMLANHTLVLYAIGLAVFMAGLTSILPNSEVALQILQYLLKTGRNRAAVYLTGLVLLVGVLDSPPSVADMMLRAVSTALFVTAIFEMYPIISRKEGMTPVQLGVVLISGALFIVGFLIQLGHDINLGGIYYASALLALIVVLAGLFGEALMPKTEEGA
ncbi:sodium-dependent transporter [Thermococcus zilligii]|uniref:sodium-dependent transporter n=1 Tax=Thermococcus zilligii TaxID=54076 RepID=UPI000A56BD2E|nr:sodium-dependent transporter [Thermococcus zilligii]